MAGQLVFLCDLCGDHGINTRKELLREGWQINPAGKDEEGNDLVITLCADCVRHCAKKQAKE